MNAFVAEGSAGLAWCSRGGQIVSVLSPRAEGDVPAVYIMINAGKRVR
jgi:hypothetical protein